jgi:hypothetical protein
MLGSFYKAYIELAMAVLDLKCFDLQGKFAEDGFIHNLYQIEYFQHS